MSDGAAALLLCSTATANAKNLLPLAKIVSTAQTGIDPLVMVCFFFFSSFDGGVNIWNF